MFLFAEVPQCSPAATVHQACLSRPSAYQLRFANRPDPGSTFVALCRDSRFQNEGKCKHTQTDFGIKEEQFANYESIRD